MALDRCHITAALWLFLPALLTPLPSFSSDLPQSFCPDPCDCSDPRHLVCTNRGLRTVPTLVHAQDQAEKEAVQQKEVLIFSLGGNFISNISSSDLSSFSRLLRLNLQYNQIQNIQLGAFRLLAQLEELYLGHNLLSSLPIGVFWPLKKLRVLDGNNNLLSKIQPGLFSQGLQGLVRLRLDGNFIRVLQDQNFQGLNCLHHLHLDRNRLRHIHKRAFSGLVQLRLLSLQHNQLTDLHSPLTFAPLEALTSLLLSHNLLQKVSSRVFLQLGNLSTLSLSHNRISRLEAGALLGLSRLKQLLLDSNQLQEVPAGLLDSLVQLEELDLSRNRIFSVAAQAFAQLGRLKVLRLQENLLSSLSGEVFAFNLQLRMLDLRGNNWTCDCQLKGLKAWMSTVHEQGRLLSRSSLQCSHPEVLQGKYLEHVDSSQLLHLQKSPNLCKSQVKPEGSQDGENGGIEVREKLQGLQERDLQEEEEEIWSREAQKPLGKEDENEGKSKEGEWKSEALGEENQEQALQEDGHSLQQRSPEELEKEEEEIWRREWEKERKEMDTLKDETKEKKREEEEAGVQEDDEGVEILAAKKPPKKQKESLRPRSKPAEEVIPTGSRTGRQRSKVMPRDGRFENFTDAKRLLSSTSHLLLLRPLPVVTDPCDFNRHFISNVSVGHVTSATATVHWTCREHRGFTLGREQELGSGPEPGPSPEEVQFRILFDRFGTTNRFPRYVYTTVSTRTITLQELLPDTTYMVCVEGVVRRSICQVAPRDHCAGLVTPPARSMLTFDLQFVTLAAANIALLLLLLVGGAWLGRSLRRRLQQQRRRRRSGRSGRSAMHVYATSRPFRHTAEFSYRAPVPLEEQEGDLIQFPCDRFLEGGGGAGSGGSGAGGGVFREGSMTQFSD